MPAIEAAFSRATRVTLADGDVGRPGLLPGGYKTKTRSVVATLLA